VRITLLLRAMLRPLLPLVVLQDSAMTTHVRCVYV
jgi:hypothetical protein